MAKRSSSKLGYGVGNLGYSVVSQTITNFFMFFGTSVLKLSGLSVGIAIAISTLWDGLTDPIVGYISDRHSLFGLGHRRGFMLLATFGMVLFNIFIWFVPVGGSGWLKFSWITLGLVAIETFNTLYSTPYMALGTDISVSYNDRTRIQISKTVFFLIGMIVPTLLLYIFLPNTAEYPVGQLNPLGYRYMSAVTSIICLISGLGCIIFTRPPKRKKYQQEGKFSFKEIFTDFVGTIKIKSLATIIFGYSIVMLSGVILTSVGMHFFTYCFNLSSGQITILLSALLIGTLVSQPIWYYASLARDKKSALLGGIFVSVTGVFLIITIFLMRFKLGDMAYWWIMLAIFISGLGSGALYSLPTSMYSDAITKENRRLKCDKTATYSGALTFTSNIFNCLLQLIVGIMLDLIKFDPNELQQSLSVQTGLAIILFVGIQISLISGYYLFSKSLIKSKSAKIVQQNAS